jgi:hypothetical protein
MNMETNAGGGIKQNKAVPFVRRRSGSVGTCRETYCRSSEDVKYVGLTSQIGLTINTKHMSNRRKREMNQKNQKQRTEI